MQLFYGEALVFSVIEETFIFFVEVQVFQLSAFEELLAQYTSRGYRYGACLIL